MDFSLMIPEIAVLVAGVALLLLDLWTPPERKRVLGYGAALGLLLVLVYTCLRFDAARPEAFSIQTSGGLVHPFVIDGLALFFKRFFLLAAIIVLLIAVEFANR